MVELRLIKGKDLKEKRLAKVISNDNTACCNYKYKIGKNIDCNELNLTYQFGAGLYFVELKDAYNYRGFGNNLAILELDDEQDVVEIREKNECGKITISYRTHSFKITKIVSNFKKKDTRWLELDNLKFASVVLFYSQNVLIFK